MIICYIIIFIYDLINLQGNGGKKINNSIISHFNHWVIYIIYRGRKKGKKIFDENWNFMTTNLNIYLKTIIFWQKKKYYYIIKGKKEKFFQYQR